MPVWSGFGSSCKPPRRNPTAPQNTATRQRKDVLFSLENRTSFVFLFAIRVRLRFIWDKQGLKAIVEHMDSPDAG